MYERVLTVKYITSKNCFCMLSPNNLKQIKTSTLKLTDEKVRNFYVSIASAPGPSGDSYIYISSIYAKFLQLEDNSKVVLTEIAKPPTVQSVIISCLNNEDYSILELLAENVQSTLLQQVRVLCNSQCFVIWSGNIFIPVTVCDIKPKSPGYIDNYTEVLIEAPRPNKIRENNNKNSVSLILRTVPIKRLCSEQNLLPFEVFISKNKDSLLEPQICRIKLLSSDEKIPLYVRLNCLEDRTSLANSISAENIFVSESVWKYFKCEPGSRVLLEFCYDSYSVDEIEVFVKKSANIESTFKDFLAKNCSSQSFILSQNVNFTIGDNIECYVRFQPLQAKFCLVDEDFVRNCKISVCEDANFPTIECNKIESIPPYTLEVSNYQEILEKSVFLLTQTNSSFARRENIIIEGRTGSGKTTLVNILCKKLESQPCFYNVHVVNCKSIKGKTCESLHKILTAILFDLIHRQPSLLVLDDLEVLCENTNDSDPAAQNAIYSNRISEMLAGLLELFTRNNSLAIVATTQSISKLNKSIYSSRGNHLFKNTFQIRNLERNDREILLKFLLKDCDFDGVDLGILSQKTDSFSMQDLQDFVMKIQFESYQTKCDVDKMVITSNDCDVALEEVTNAILDGINLHPKGLKDLSDIGGMENVKKILLEILLWPSKYPTIFDNAPLKLPSGLLLYGPPGTGKTILAGAIAKHCSLRLISIKGPELLSKYIGASEQAVRDLFQRAQNAKPCLLFFDEFDSLAPRRGHDNTGVTDRVVNQLLTQLDGVETLTGVFILAATSRPDLLDPALLRPGRLDRHIQCKLPDEVERLDVLKALSKSLKLSKDVDFGEIAKETATFSGADLQAVLYTAQLDGMQDLIEENDQQISEITQELLVNAARKTRPSLSTKELIKYERIYNKFEGGSSSDFQPGSRATLA